MQTEKPWIGVELEGGLVQGAHLAPASCSSVAAFGPAIPAMVRRVKQWLAQGRQVRIVTPRAADPLARMFVQNWSTAHLGRELPVTCHLDAFMSELWGGRCVQVGLDGVAIGGGRAGA